MSAPRHIGSAAPFTSAAIEYTRKGWNVVPLPPHKKKSPPDDVTGRMGRFTTEYDLQDWMNDPEWSKGNIAIRAGNVVTVDNTDYEIIGIDVDAYDGKHGAEHLAQLEKSYGPLPSTWTSSARDDSISGIRWFLSPIGYEYMGKPRLANGKASDSIEIVQRVHRYGLVFPSWHPDTKGQYWWYDRGVKPDGTNTSERIPYAKELAVLPDSWWKFLTRNGTEATGDQPIDMDMPTKALYLWADKRFASKRDHSCRQMRMALARQRKSIEESTDHHDPLVRFHWQVYHLGAEGHSHWKECVGLLEKDWLAKVSQDNARGLTEAKSEIARSREGTLRKIKGTYDEFRKQGVQFIERFCTCKSDGPPPLIPVNTASDIPPSEHWERNEDGNAEHFLELFKSNVKYVPNHADGVGRWLVFLEDENRWVVDSKETIVRNMFRQVKIRQQTDAARMLRDANLAVQAAGGLTAATAQQKADLSNAKAWVTWANESGNKARVINSLIQATTFPGVSMLYEELDADNMILPCANGILRFHTKEERLAGKAAFEWIHDPEAIKTMMVTQNTMVPYIPFKDQRRHKDPAISGNFKKFSDYMDMFLKRHMDAESWKYTLKLLGLSILGVNIKKAVFLVGIRDTGKSTFQNMMASALGELAIWREPRIFEDSNFKGSLAEALSRRVAMVGELGERHMDASLFKRITGGDEVSCQLKNINKPVTLRARCTIISGCNSAPDVPNVDDATKERFVVIPFKHQVTRAEKDPNAQDDLMLHCKVPLLAMLVEYCSVAVMEGINEIPDGLQLETNAFVSTLSEMSDFLTDCLIIVPQSETSKYGRKDEPLDLKNPKPRMPDDLCLGSRTLYAAYTTYCQRNGVDKLSMPALTRRLKGQGLVQDGSKNKQNEMRWLGLTLTKGMQRVQQGDLT